VICGSVFSEKSIGSISDPVVIRSRNLSTGSSINNGLDPRLSVFKKYLSIANFSRYLLESGKIKELEFVLKITPSSDIELVYWLARDFHKIYNRRNALPKMLG